MVKKELLKKAKEFNNFCVIDTETRGLNARPEAFIFGVVYAHNFEKVFLDREEMKEWLCSNLNPYKYIFAHNAEYDYTVLFDNIILHMDRSALFVGSTFIQAKIGKKVFSNSLPILKSSVEQLGKHLGMEKGILDDKFKRGDKDIEVTKEDIFYCKRDCEIIYVYLEKVFGYTNKIKPTVASCAMEIFRKEFLKRKFIKNPLNEKFRHSYYGGRVECFRFGKINPCFKYDINSLYPYVCTKMFFPDFNKMKQGKKCTISHFEKYILPNYEGCVHITVEHKKNFIGVLPYRKKTEIVFPYGIYSQWYNFNELRYALKTGLVKIKAIKEYVFAPRIQFTELREYMLHFYKLKDESNGAEKLLNKFFLNALTGKFAQKDYGAKTYFETTEEAFKFINSLHNGQRIDLHHFSEERDDLFVEVFDERRSNKITWNIPTISSYITSEARLVMLPFFLKYQKHVLYTDTDSLVMDIPLDKKFVNENIIGMFKKEDDNEIEIKGNKHYSSKVNGEKVYHIKGVSKNFTRRGKNFKFKKMVKTKESINRNTHAGMFIEVVKHLSGDYSKRIVKNNKTQTLKLTEK